MSRVALTVCARNKMEGIWHVEKCHVYASLVERICHDVFIADILQRGAVEKVVKDGIVLDFAEAYNVNWTYTVD